MRGWKYLVAGCVNDMTELEQTLVANMLKEKTLFRVARAYEMITETEEWRKVKPEVLRGRS